MRKVTFQYKIFILLFVLVGVLGHTREGRQIDLTVGFQSTSNDYLFEKGSFELNNTAEEKWLMKYGFTETNLGATYNISITLHPNSSSSVTFHLFPDDNTWEGPHTFQVVSNETKSAIFIQHAVYDEKRVINLQYQLDNSSKLASGEYKVVRLFNGYPTDIGTGGIYVDNITRWLELKSQSYSTTSHLNPGFLVVPLILAVILYSIRKKRINV